MRVLRDTAGVVYVEFLLVFLPVFLLFLAVLQLGFVYVGRLVVQHAASRATRAAVVILDDDPALYANQPRGQLAPAGSSATPSPVEPFMAGTALGAGAGNGRGGPRFRDIHAAASLPLLAVAPSTAQLLEDDSVRNAIGIGAERAASGAEQYNQAALAVTFPTEPGASAVRTEFEPTELVTARVTYLFHCSVPLVPQLMCDSPGELAGTLSAAEQAQLDLGYLSSLANARFLVLRAEATLPNQGAGYLYPGEQ